MVKKIILILSVVVFVFLGTSPVFAQTSTTTARQGFFTDIAQFFGEFFQNHGAPTKMQNQTEQNVTGTPKDDDTSRGMISPNPSGQPNFQTAQEYRLTRLVQAGKITEAQKEAIISELVKVQTELKTWAQTEGIDPSYVLSGPMMGSGGMMYRQGGGQGPSQNNVPQAQPQNQ